MISSSSSSSSDSVKELDVWLGDQLDEGSDDDNISEDQNNNNNIITLNVGGTQFITSACTLQNNSVYFNTLLSERWAEGDEIFLDRNPTAFSKLLDYMRDDMINVEDIDTNVLKLADYLGIERLLIAIKVRWYNNIGRGAFLTNDDDISAAFDELHGGIMNAISSGLYPYFLRPDDVDAEKDIAKLGMGEPDKLCVTVKLTRDNRDFIRCGQWAEELFKYDDIVGGLTGALNGLYSKGYTKYEEQFTVFDSWEARGEDEFSFSRRKHHLPLTSIANDIFIQSEDESRNTTKQFAMIVKDIVSGQELVIAPVEFSEDPEVRNDPFKCATILSAPSYSANGDWFEMHGFLTREESYEQVFKEHIKAVLRSPYMYNTLPNKQLQCRLYSRNKHCGV